MEFFDNVAASHNRRENSLANDLTRRNARRMLQDEFLSALQKTHMTVMVYLVNGIKLQGRIDGFDQFGILLGGNAAQFVYKRAISTIVSTREMTPVIAPPDAP